LGGRLNGLANGISDGLDRGSARLGHRRQNSAQETTLTRFNPFVRKGEKGGGY